MSTLYLKGAPETVAKYVVFSGDPQRVEQIVGFLSEVRKVAVSREFFTYTGLYEGLPVTVTSTGIGAPSAAIALEEMYACGMKAAVRLGTVMGLQEGMLGKFVIPVGAVRDDGTTGTYVPQSYPAGADMRLGAAMNQSAARSGRGYLNGIVASCDGFYSQMKDGALARRMGLDVDEKIEAYRKAGVAGIDMETSTVLTLGRLMGISAGTVTLTPVSEKVSSELKNEDRRQAEKVDLIRVVLDGLKLFDEREGNEG